MAINVDIDVRRVFEVRAPFNDVFDLVSNVPLAASFFPRLNRLTDLGGGTYRWEMEKLGNTHVNVQIAYASHYVVDRARAAVVWTPVAGEGNALIGGSWTMVDRGKTTALALDVHGSASLPLPGLMKVVVSRLAKAEFTGLVDRYIETLSKHLGGV